jgi:N-methylhydantoinase A/oxoprolinase/acetone carboxylase beta subunit
MESISKYHVGVDVGGTFTDLIYFKEGSSEVKHLKVDSTVEI